MTPNAGYQKQSLAKVCGYCQADFVAFGKSRFRLLYCSDKCSNARKSKGQFFRPEFTGRIPKNSVGAISELRVCADLLGRGYDVYRAQSPNSKADLVVVIRGKCFKVAVKTGAVRISTGRIDYAPERNPDHDIFAIVIVDSIVYRTPQGSPYEFGGNEWKPLP